MGSNSSVIQSGSPARAQHMYSPQTIQYGPTHVHRQLQPQQATSTTLPSRQSIGYSTPSRHRGIYSQQAETIPADFLLSSPESTPSPPNPPSLRLICNCDNGPRPNARYIPCKNCGHLQHAACAPEDNGEETTRDWCSECKYASLEGRLHTMKQQQAALTHMVMRKRNIVRIFYHEVLWKQYCSIALNDPRHPDLATLRYKTQLGYDGVPRFRAPQAWVDEMQRCVWRMREQAGEQVSNRYMTPRSEWEMVDLRILLDWQTLAIWMLDHGPYAPRSTGMARLGVLAELLGFAPKGTFWQG